MQGQGVDKLQISIDYANREVLTGVDKILFEVVNSNGHCVCEKFSSS